MSTRSHLWMPLLRCWPGLLRPPSVRQRHWPARWASWVKGDASLASRRGKDERGGFPETATTRTQGGGRHLIYVAPDGPLKGGNHKLGNGIDVKAADQAPRKRRPKAKTATRARKQQAIPSKQ
jgi:hypothetical protein